MTYRQFDTGAWQDPWFESLSPQAKLIFIYLWTNDVCNQAGMYEISKRRIEFEVGFNIDDAMKELDSKVLWDTDKNIVWVKSFFKWQCQNESFAIGALKQIENSPYLKEYLTYNAELIKKYKIWQKYMVVAGLGDNNPPSGHHGDTVQPPSGHHGDTHPASEQNRTEQKQNKEANASCPEPEKSDSSPEPDPPENLSEPFCEIVLSGGKYTHLVTEDDIAEYQDAYPGIDVRQEIRKCQQWNKSSPTRRKTKSGIRRHISSWLGKAQDAVGSQQPVNGTAKTRTDRNRQACIDFVKGAPDAR